VEDKIKSSRRNSKKFLKELFNKAKLGVTEGFIFSAKSGRDVRRADADYCLVLIGPQSWGVFGIGEFVRQVAERAVVQRPRREDDNKINPRRQLSVWIKITTKITIN